MSKSTAESSNLPIEGLYEAFTAALEEGACVVAAATGSGKSTRLPLWAAEHGPVLVVQPRRVAATSLAEYCAAACGEKPGGTVGHAVRLDRCFGPDTRILFVTPGVALRWRAEERLDGFTTVLIDEYHERRWDTDLLLALLQADSEHRLAVTSATMDGEAVAKVLGGRYLDAPGRNHPVGIQYLSEDPRQMPSSRDLAERVAGAVEAAVAETEGDCLVFLPGRGEIDAVRRLLEKRLSVSLVKLHGGADLQEQRQAMVAGAERRVVLATNVAETSLTVPGITAVVDSGLERRTLRRNGRTVLSLQPIAQANADQRAGRAGRLAPGICYRLWGRAAPIPQRTPPEVAREELTELVLAAACAGYGVSELPFVEPPREESIQQAYRALRELGAVDSAGVATERGRQLFRLPLDPEWAHLVEAMPDTETRTLMADIVASLAAGSPVRLSGEARAREETERFLGRRCEVLLRIAAVRCGRVPGADVQPGGQQQARLLSQQLRDLLGLPALNTVSEPDGMGGGVPGVTVKALDRMLAAAATALPHWVFVRREQRRQALGNGQGDEVILPERSWLPEATEFALVLDAHSVPGRGTRQTVTMAACTAPLSADLLVAAGVCAEHYEEPRWEDGTLTAHKVRTFAGRPLSRDTVIPEGAALRELAARLILEERLLAPAGRRLLDDLEAYAVYVALGYEKGAVPEGADWLVGRLEQLGVESATDLELLEAEDLQFQGIPDWERPDFEERFPRRLRLPDLELRVHYHPRRREVIVEKVGGIRRSDPKRWELPAWPGWRVRFQRASRVVDVR